jgi:hypothetical protein
VEYNWRAIRGRKEIYGYILVYHTKWVNERTAVCGKGKRWYGEHEDRGSVGTYLLMGNHRGL